MYNVADIRALLAEKYQNEDFVIDKSGVKTVELIGTSFIANEDRIFGEVNHDWNSRELTWYLSQSLKVADIPAPIPKIWELVSSSNGEINSNYGYLFFSKENGNQYEYVLNELKSNRDTRRASAIYTRPTMHVDYNRDGMSDFVCTWGVQYMVRDNKLVSHVIMRSNDSILGYKGDFAWHKYASTKLANELGIAVGNTIWTASSLHVYERHFQLLQKWIDTGIV